MNAHKFVADFGIEKAKEALSLCCWLEKSFCTRFWCGCIKNNHDCCVDVEKLKQVVESLDTIDRLFGPDQAKHTMKIAKEIGYSSDYEQIKQAIADYEAVESYKQVNCEVLDIVDASPQKRIDELCVGIRKLIEEYKSEEKELELKEWEQSTIYGRIAIELEEALKGGED
ncbi:hypothetical protein KTH71_04385 [Acinetobacter sp. WU_MDCI_Axc73]|nr:hypothetical protein [Acinetobacter sp. WU_MDCI_Axc73]